MSAVSESPVLSRSLAHVVSGGPAVDFDRLDDAEWGRLVADARSQRLVGLLAGVVAEGGGLAEPARLEQLTEVELVWAVHTLRAERTLVEVVRAFGDRGIEHRVLKGSAFAHRHWPRPELRTFVDADVLVRSSDLERAVAVVEEMGGSRPLPELRRGFDRRFGKSVTMKSASGTEVDLHRRLVAGPHAFLIPEADLWGPAEFMTVAGTSLACLAASVELVHAAVHTTASRVPRLSNVADVAFIGERCDLDAAGELAERWQVRAMVREAGDRLAAVLPDHPVAQWATELPVSAEEERLLDLFVGAEQSFRRSAMASVRHVPGTVNRARFLLTPLPVQGPPPSPQPLRSRLRVFVCRQVSPL